MISSRRWPADEQRNNQEQQHTSPSFRKGTGNGLSPHSSNIQYTDTLEFLSLEMSGNGIRSLPTSIFLYNSLRELRLSNNQLRKLPIGISQLRSLNYLDISNNNLTHLPSEIGWLTNLRDLFIYNNDIQSFPPEVGFLFQLENFGIDGNPLAQDFIQLAHSQGSLAIIRYMRDHALSSTISPPSDRIWNQYIDLKDEDKKISLICYNILCDKYATPQMFGFVPSWFLAWEYRKQLILHEILAYDADVICLQEVEMGQFEQFFRPQLRMRGGYEGIFSPKSRSKTMSDWDKNFVDGCATFWKTARFRLEERDLIDFTQVALSRPSLKKHKDIYNRVMSRDNVALVSLLEDKESEQFFLISNCHIHWDPSFRDVKLIQTIMMVEELEKMQVNRESNLIICGDFNSLPGSGVYSFLENGFIDADNEDFMSHNYEPYTSEGAKHSLMVKNSMSSLPDPLIYTNFTPSFLGIIDYIWYRPGSLSVSGNLGPVTPEYSRQLVGIPSQHLPSDHVSLVVEFKIEEKVKRDVGSSAAAAKRLYSRN